MILRRLNRRAVSHRRLLTVASPRVRDELWRFEAFVDQSISIAFSES